MNAKGHITSTAQRFQCSSTWKRSGANNNQNKWTAHLQPVVRTACAFGSGLVLHAPDERKQCGMRHHTLGSTTVTCNVPSVLSSRAVDNPLKPPPITTTRRRAAPAQAHPWNTEGVQHSSNRIKRMSRGAQQCTILNHPAIKFGCGWLMGRGKLDPSGGAGARCNQEIESLDTRRFGIAFSNSFGKPVIGYNQMLV